MDALCQDLARPADAPRRPPCACAPALSGVDTWTLMRVLDEIDYGLMVVDADSRVRYANRAALAECGGRHALRLDEGRLTARHVADAAPLRRAFAAAAQGRRTLLNVEAVTVAVVPLTAAAPTPVQALVVMGKREPCPELSVDFYARAHQLTGAESQVLKGLCSGLRPLQIAADGGVAISTVRTQIGAIRAKTGARGIRELVGRVAALPPIASQLTQHATGAGLAEAHRAAAASGITSPSRPPVR